MNDIAPADGGRLDPGDAFPVDALADATVVGPGRAWPPPAQEVTHLQFRRFAGCPICNLHLRRVAQRLPEIEAAGIREVIVFHSTEAELDRYLDELPFVAVADPTRRLYRAIGAETSPLALLHPRLWPSLPRIVVEMARAMGRGRFPLHPTGGEFGRPADVLLAPDGRVLAAHYGDHADDQWEVDEVLALHREAGTGEPVAPDPSVSAAGADD